MNNLSENRLPYIASNRALGRRSFLRSMGVALALPMLESMRPAIATAANSSRLNATVRPRRMLAICNNLGLLPTDFFPAETGFDYQLSPYLELIKEHRQDFTIFSGVSHPDVDGGHPADNCFLTAAPNPGRSGFQNTISLDKYVAERVGHLTRFPSLNLGVNVAQGARSLSWTNSGVMIPCEESAANVYRLLFMDGTEEEKDEQIRKLELGQSILDAVSDQTRSLQRQVGGKDRERLDQYFTSVRELERRMEMSKEWAHQPKPKVDAPVPLDPSDPRQYMEKVRLMYDMARLAFETDSTRSIALMLDSVNSPALDLDGYEITNGYHNLSHHGKDEEKLSQLRAIDHWHMKLIGGLLTDLRAVKEDGETLLDRTMVLYGSNLGNAHTHVNTNLPILLAGGGFRHGQHIGFDREHNYPLPNLFVSMIQRMGIEADKFASSTGSMRNFRMV